MVEVELNPEEESYHGNGEPDYDANRDNRDPASVDFKVGATGGTKRDHAFARSGIYGSLFFRRIFRARLWCRRFAHERIVCGDFNMNLRFSFRKTQCSFR
ncbi:MAG: hypothetical protein ACLP05_13150 [Candidatus Kryptoniota bacterium]